MPSDSQSQTKRPSGATSSSSQRRTHDNSDNTLSSTPPPHKEHKVKTKHPVTHRLHTRVPSTRALSKLKAHAPSERPRPPTSPALSPVKRVGSEPKLSRDVSVETLPKTGSHANLRRNKSHTEVRKTRGTAGGMRRSASHTSVQKSQRSNVHFDLGNADAEEADDGWTEASGSASPNLSRAGSSGRSSAKAASATNSKPSSLAASPAKTRDWTGHNQPDAHQITSRLLQRVPSHGAAPQMSAVSATATTSSSPGAPSTATPPISRFKGAGSSASGTPASTSPFPAPRPPSPAAAAPARAKSMSNLTDQERDESSSEDRALGPRARKTTSYAPPRQSRTQQKLWLQRASSNIEPVQVAPAGALGLGLGGLGMGMAGMAGVTSPLVGSLGLGYPGEVGDPRIRMVCGGEGDGEE